MGKRVGQRGNRHRMGEVTVSERSEGVLAEGVGGGAHFSWLGQSRRLSKDYERLPESGEAFIHVAMSRLMVRRLARS